MPWKLFILLSFSNKIFGYLAGKNRYLFNWNCHIYIFYEHKGTKFYQIKQFKQLND